MSQLDDFRKDLDENKKGNERAEFYKLKNGDNKIVILSNPIGYSELFGIGIAYQDCGYAEYSSRRYKCYVLDLEENVIKIANFSYTVSRKIVALGDGARTKFEGFPMPYVINLKTESAGTKNVNTEVLADEDYSLTLEQENELANYDSVQDIIDRLKSSQKKKVDSDPALQQKIKERIDAILIEREKNKNKDKTMGTVKTTESEDSIEYPADEINPEDIPF